MGKAAAEIEGLNRKLSTYMSDIHETLQILDQTPSNSLQKGSWVDVISMGDQLSKQATAAGMLFCEERTKVKHLEENMGSYFNVLQGLLLHAYGSTVSAGPTLTSNIHASIKQVVDCSFTLWGECVSHYGSRPKELKDKIPPRVGTVWEACSALKKTPATNIVAIGRAMTQVAVSMKDVLREMKELQPCSSDENDGTECQKQEESTSAGDNDDNDDDDDDDDDLGKDLTPEEMKIVNLALQTVSEIVIVIKELIRSITSLLKTESYNEKDGVEALETLLKLSRYMAVQVDELGACLYPPQEHSPIATACEKISNLADEMSKTLESINGLTEAFSKSCSALEKALEMLQSELSNALEMLQSELSNDSAVEATTQKNSSTSEVVGAMQDLSVQDIQDGSAMFD